MANMTDAVAEASPQSSLHRTLATGLLATVALALSLWLLPIDSDGAFAINDGIHYAAAAESGKTSVIARHPLFHVLVQSTTGALRALGAAHPGHIAIRIVSGVGAAWLVIVLTLLAGRQRWYAGWLCGCFALSCRFVLLDSAAGETVVIATAASLSAFALALRPQPSWPAVGVALIVALLFRQDNVLAVPGLALVLWPSARPPRRFLRLAAFFVVVGAVTLGVYAFMWWLNASSETFGHWMVAAAHSGQWGTGLTAERMLTHLDAMGDATVGAVWGWDDPKPWVGPTVLGTVLIGGVLLHGTQAAGRFITAMLLTVVIRFFFHSWWAPVPQFHVYNIGAVAAAAAFAARDPSPFLPLRARAGLVLVALAILVTVLCHWPSTRILRERRLMESVGYAGALSPPGARFMARGTAAQTALWFMGIGSIQMPHDRATMTKMVAEELRNGRPLIVFFDRFTLGNRPAALIRPGQHDADLDKVAPTPGTRLVRIDGLVVATISE
jgi:hypothetical protein